MNNIELSTIYLPILDKLYKQEAKTSILDGDETTVKKGANGEIKIAKLDMSGLGDFSRSSGYTSGDVSFVWETVKYDKERSQKLKIDRLDNEEALAMPFARVSGEFIRTKVVPETDAARIATIAGKAGTDKAETLEGGADVIAALRACSNTMDEAEVPAESRILFITPTLRASIDDLDTTKSRLVLSRFSNVIEVPGNRMNTGILLNDGTSAYGYKTGDQYVLLTAQPADWATGYTGYYTKSGSTYSAVTGSAAPAFKANTYYKKIVSKAINFLCVEKSAVVCAMDQFIKYFTPDQDQEGDNHVFAYRNYNLYGHVYENKTAGVYVSHKA